CAFNKSIATEIASRFSEKGMNMVTTKTMHALGLQILRNNNSTGKEFNLKDNKYDELIKDNDIKRQFRPYIIKIIKYHGHEFDEYSEKQTYEVDNIIRNFTIRLLDINRKYRLTLCRDSYKE